MALRWDAAKVTGIADLDSSERQTMEMLLWGMVAIGMREITETNVDECFARLSLIEKLEGAFRVFYSVGEDRKPMPFTKEDVRRFVGLSTNVSPLSKTKFLNQVLENHSRRVS